MEDSAAAMDVDAPKTKLQKRKRESPAAEVSTPEQKEAKIDYLKREIEGLFRYYREMMMEKKTDMVWCREEGFSSVNAAVAVLIEEKGLPLSKLVDDIYPKVKERVESVTVASVKSAVVFVGQRVMYGLQNDDADVLEDDTESCLWCWETRDLKLMPKSVRGALKIRRTCRKKIHERITAVSAMITALQKSENDKSSRHDLSKASEKLGRVLSEADIRLLVDNMLQKNNADMAEKEVKREEKKLIKQLEKNKREAEKEKKRIDREMQKERLQNEKEQRRLQEEVEKEMHKEKEEAEMRKRKQEEDAEKEQRRREKEQAELKKQLAIQKQASIMERFLKRSKTASSSQNETSCGEVTASNSLSKMKENASETVTESMDYAFASCCEISIDELRRAHLSSWHQSGRSMRSNPKQCWGIRRKPKAELFSELKLSGSREMTLDNELSTDKAVDGWEEKNFNSMSCISSDSSISNVKKFRRKQLLQFDKSYRPAFYGIWPTKSGVVGPCHPLRKDPDLDYEIDSDEEWEEEEPGESLSDCDKDEEESVEEGCSKADDEDESEDGFFVPDGYLSEDEGVQVEKIETDPVEEPRSTPHCKQDQESEEFCALLRQQKYLYNLTEHALRKNQPLIICNLMHEKVPLLAAKYLDGSPKLEQTCLQALSIRAFPGVPLIEISTDDMQDEDQEVCKSSCKHSTPAPSSSARTILDSDLPTVVSVIQSCSQGINKVVETLQQKFPDFSKTQLKIKVREISDFEDNRWQVKKDILAKLGLSSSPDKGIGRTKSISSFFSKRCLPPSFKSGEATESSPPSLEPGPAAEEQQLASNV